MAEHVFRMPDVGEGITEAELVEWFVAVGDDVQVDQPLGEVMTDKATIEISSPVAGVVRRLGGGPGDIVAVGAELIAFQVDGADAVPTPAPPPTVVPVVAAPVAVALAPTPSPAPTPTPVLTRGRALASPAVRRRALDAEIDLAGVAGSGPAGRVEHDDLDRHLQRGTALVAVADQVVDVPLVGMRRRIAERMVLSATRIPHFTYVDDVDVTALEDLRRSLNDAPADRPRLTLLPFLVRALVRSLTDFPAFNARFDEDEGVVRQHRAVHAGIATQTPKGLVVPVMRHAERHGLWACAAEVRRLAEAARAGAATAEELQGSTITITSLGALGGLVTTPIINHPEVAVIGVNKVQVRPVWVDDGFVPRQVMNISCSFDHRVVDGWDAALFVQRVKQLLEQPASLFIEGA